MVEGKGLVKLLNYIYLQMHAAEKFLLKCSNIRDFVDGYSFDAGVYTIILSDHHLWLMPYQLYNTNILS